MKKGPKKKALAYLRRSNGVNDSASEKRQREAIDRAAAHAGYVIEEDGYFFDAKISGASELEDRPALQKLFAILEDGDYDTIFCEAIDRIARSTLCGQVLCNQLKEMGVTAYDSFGKNLTTSTDGEQNLIRDIMLCIASYEREKIVARMLHGRKRKKKDLKAKARKNNRISTKVEGKKAFGEDSKIEQAIIKKIKTLRKSKSKKHSTWGGIALALNESGFTNRAGNPWRMANVRKIGMANGLN
ncbi:recombinase family protein [Verrucomicrobia bacterium]|jgi:DNA invertase Pin-like site-specific DNA recombinase|nr:recombinase family protein [Verrucomicrobiota bacterium]